MRPELEQQAQELVRLALRNKVTVDQSRLLAYARIKVAADSEVLTRNSAEEHAKAAIYHRVATYLELDHTSAEADDIGKAAARARQAMNRIGQSAKAARIALKRLSAVAERNRDSAPPHFRRQLGAHNIYQLLGSICEARAGGPDSSGRSERKPGACHKRRLDEP